jgi:hypothetical protein
MSEELERLTRDELNVRAEEAGVADPAELPNKAAVVDAILAAGGGARPSSRTAQQAIGARRLPTPQKARLLRRRRARGQL